MRKKRVLSEEHKKKISASQLGRKKIFSEEAIENIRIAASKRKGIKTGAHTEETKQKIRDATKGKKKTIIERNPAWFPKGHIPKNPFKKGNKSWNEGKLLTDSRKGRKYKLWRASVLSRDENRCVKCGSTHRLHAHHLKTWKDFPEFRFDVDNGQTLCNSCHSKEEGLRPENINREQQFKKGHKGHRRKQSQQITQST